MLAAILDDITEVAASDVGLSLDFRGGDVTGGVVCLGYGVVGAMFCVCLAVVSDTENGIEKLPKYAFPSILILVAPPVNVFHTLFSTPPDEM